MGDGFGFDALIEALTVLKKYAPQTSYPTHCEHDVLTVVGPDPADVSEADMMRLDELGFFVGDFNSFQSFRFGSA